MLADTMERVVRAGVSKSPLSRIVESSREEHEDECREDKAEDSSVADVAEIYTVCVREKILDRYHF